MRVLGFAILVAVLLVAGFVGSGYIGGGTSVIDRVSSYLTPASGSETPDAATGLLAQQEKTPLFYRDPMGLPEISAEPKKDSMGMDYIPVYPDADQGTGKILFYRNPMGELDVSPAPKKDSMGMDYIPVREQPVQKSSEAQPASEGISGKAKPIYYRNPMGLPDISYEPKKDSMGMDYIPVYEDGAASEGNVVTVSLDKVQKLGVMTAPAVEKQLSRTIRAVGSVQPDESRQIAVSSRFDGWVDKLYVSKTGDQVEKGQKLLEISSPDLRAAQRNYLTAIKQSPELLQVALERLQNQGISKQQVAELQDQRAVPPTTGIYASGAGQVVEKNVIQGAWVKAGDMLYRLLDLHHVWVIAEVYERDLAAIEPGQQARITFSAYPGKTFSGAVSLIYPEISMATRTAKVRIELDNKDLQFRSGMYADVEIATDLTAVAALSVPESAVLDDGEHQTVLVALGEGRFEPRPVRLGGRADGHAEVLEGLAAGENVVVSANFLIDAESNLQAALRAFVGRGDQPKEGANTAVPQPTANTEQQP
jgi:Cu(I)/Ag(I) efflux system membrane fusion protein